MFAIIVDYRIDIFTRRYLGEGRHG